MLHFFQSAGRFINEIPIVFRLLGPTGAATWLAAAAVDAPTLLKTKSLTAADRAIGAAFQVRCADRSLRFIDGEFGVCREIMGHDCYRVVPLCGGLHTIMDLGCNCGTFTLMAATLNPGSRIIAVDANPEFTAATLRNAKANGLHDQVEVLNCVVGDAEVESVEAIRAEHNLPLFDPAASIAKLGGCDFLKCDVEGGEHMLFQGDLRWLREVRHVALEYHWTDSDGDRLAAVLRQEGFTVQRRPHRNLGYLFGWRA